MQSEGSQGPTGTGAAAPPAATPYSEEHETEELHVHLPPLSIWPISTAAGITLAGAGLVTNPAVVVGGVVIMLLSVASWIQELRHERHESH